MTGSDYAQRLAEHIRKKKADAELETKKILFEQELKKTEGPKSFQLLRQWMETTIKDTNDALGESVIELQASPAVNVLKVLMPGAHRKNHIDAKLDATTATITFTLTIGSTMSNGQFTARVSNGNLEYLWNNNRQVSIQEMGGMMLDWIAEKRQT